MEEKEIEQRIADAVNGIPIKEILQESKDNLKIKLERFEKNWNPHRGRHWRFKAAKMRKAKKECFVLSIIRKIFGH